MMRRQIMAATLLVLGAAPTGAAARPACMTPTEAEALVTVLLPGTLEAIGRRCAATLPETATLRGGLVPIVARYRSEATAKRGVAAAAAAKLGNGLPAGVDPATMLPVLEQAITTKIAFGIMPTDCAVADRIVTLLSPLPAASIAGLFIVVLGGLHSSSFGDVRFCEAKQ